MGKKGSWISAIKKAFSPSSKKKLTDGTEKKSSKEERKKGTGKFKHGDSRLFIPLFRKPSSIEKILGEVERDNQISNYKPVTPPDQPKAQPHVITPPPPPTTATPPKAVAHLRTSPPPRPASPPLQREVSPPRVATLVPARAPSPRFVQRRRLEPTLTEKHRCAVKIQTAYRGYTARRSYRAVRGLVRLQAVVKGRSVKRQTANTLKWMQLLVRVQTQIQSRRIQMSENQAMQRQVLNQNDKDLDSVFSKWNLDVWNDNTLTREEHDARMRRKAEASANREKAMAYAYTHQSKKSTPRTAQSAAKGIQPGGGFPYSWSWLNQHQEVPPKTPTGHSETISLRSFHLTPTRPGLDFKANSPLGQPRQFGQHEFNTPSPRSTKSAMPSRTKLFQTPPSRFHQQFNRASAFNSPFNGVAFRDDDSLTSCPTFSAPRYMSPTFSTKAKERGSKDSFPNSPSSTAGSSRRRASFPFGQEFKWNKGLNSESGSQKSLNLKKNQSSPSIGNVSVESTVSMPVVVGRKPFNRFV